MDLHMLDILYTLSIYTINNMYTQCICIIIMYSSMYNSCQYANIWYISIF